MSNALDADRLSEELAVPRGPYATVSVVRSTGSTNADLAASVRGGAADRTVLLAEEQTAGVGRQARPWVSPAGAGLYVSVLYRPEPVPAPRMGALALVAGLALVDAAGVAGVPCRLKWPNDALLGDGKVAGVLAELLPEPSGVAAVVILGIGLNVHPVGDVPPGAGGLPATSLVEHGATLTDRTDVAVTVLRALAEREHRWREAAGDLATAGLLAEYREHCATIGSRVAVQLPDGSSIDGRALDVDSAGMLVVDPDSGEQVTVAAGDVTHVR